MKSIGFGRSLGEIEAEVAAHNLEGDAARIAVAASYGFDTWRQLAAYLDVWSNKKGEANSASSQPFLRNACLGYDKDSPERREQAARQLAADPTLGSRDIWSAACVGDVAMVRAFLTDDPDAVRRRGGFFDWEPLLYATYSRLTQTGGSNAAVARLLLERGADPNTHFYWGGVYRFTALTGVFGHGEGGTKNCPEHPEFAELAGLLLGAGADPNDSQALYNRMFADADSVCLKLLLDAGLGPDDKCNWRSISKDGSLGPNTVGTLNSQLCWAVAHRHDERARLLIEARTPLETAPGEAPFHLTAMRTGQPEIAALLAEHGAPVLELTPLDQLVSACMAGDEEGAKRVLASDADLLRQVDEKHPRLLHEAASSGRLEALSVLLHLGADVNKVAGNNTALHAAAWAGKLQAVKLLIDSGADPHIPDSSHGSTPLGWARHAGSLEVTDFLTPLTEEST